MSCVKNSSCPKTGNREASADYEAAITASQRAFEERKRREAEQRERERMEAAQRETSTALPMPDVRVETNVNHLADLISTQNHQVANQAVKQFEQQLRDAIAMQNLISGSLKGFYEFEINPIRYTRSD